MMLFLVWIDNSFIFDYDIILPQYLKRLIKGISDN